MVVICPLNDTSATGITGWYDNRLVVQEVPGTTYESTAAYVYERYQGITCLLSTGIMLSLIHI